MSLPEAPEVKSEQRLSPSNEVYEALIDGHKEDLIRYRTIYQRVIEDRRLMVEILQDMPKDKQKLILHDDYELLSTKEYWLRKRITNAELQIANYQKILYDRELPIEQTLVEPFSPREHDFWEAEYEPTPK
jgi:hypothetical protein